MFPASVCAVRECGCVCLRQTLAPKDQSQNWLSVFRPSSATSASTVAALSSTTTIASDIEIVDECLHCRSSIRLWVLLATQYTCRLVYMLNAKTLPTFTALLSIHPDVNLTFWRE